ncbi:MAG TPA: flagellar biosynthesis protein FlhB [Alphaproteobacteria bacterium]
MADDTEKSQKTEEPTQKRLQDAHERGQVAVSRELNHWLVILAMTVVVLAFAPAMLNDVAHSLVKFIERPESLPVDPIGLDFLLEGALREVAGALLVPILLLVGAALLGSIIQTGVVFSTHAIMPDLSRISAFAGARRLFSLRAISEFGKGLVKIAIVGVVLVILLRPELMRLDLLTEGDILTDLDILRSLALRVMIGTLAVMTVVAGLDILYQRYELRRKLRMSRQEIKDELKQSEGDPMIRARIRQIRMERARRRMIAAVPTADVVVTNPTHYAVALKYERAKMAAPRLVAKGVDSLALKIREVANEHKVPLVENRPLAQALYSGVELDAEIPPEHYRAVAQVIAYVMKLRRPVRHP